MRATFHSFLRCSVGGIVVAEIIMKIRRNKEVHVTSHFVVVS
jgi:hypothetical protein